MLGRKKREREKREEGWHHKKRATQKKIARVKTTHTTSNLEAIPRSYVLCLPRGKVSKNSLSLINGTEETLLLPHDRLSFTSYFEN